MVTIQNVDINYDTSATTIFVLLNKNISLKSVLK